MTKTSKLRFTAVILLACAAALSWMNLEEWYRIAVPDETGAYPFGSEGPVPYFYKSAELYAKVAATWGAIFLMLSLSSLYTLKYGNSRVLLLTGAGFLIAVVLMLLQATF